MNMFILSLYIFPRIFYLNCVIVEIQVKGMITDFGEDMNCQFLEIIRSLLDSYTLSGTQVLAYHSFSSDNCILYLNLLNVIEVSIIKFLKYLGSCSACGAVVAQRNFEIST